MLAIFKHELRALFHSFTAYVFGAFLLVVVGLGALAYNLQAAVSNFEYVLSFAGIIFVVIVPLLTMRVIAEERRQKTDQLLYALPISTTDVVLGKYAALLVVFLVPLAVIAVYPLLRRGLSAGELRLDLCLFCHGRSADRCGRFPFLAHRKPGHGGGTWRGRDIVQLL